MRTTYNIIHWVAGSLPAAATKEPEKKGEARQLPKIELSKEEVFDLSNDYDVMIVGAREINEGTKKNPKIRQIPLIIYLDEKGMKFRQR